jgi:hypothetical protein
MEMAEEALVQGVRVLAGSGQPGGNGRLPVAENSLGSGRIQPFGQRREDHGDLLRRGFQSIQGSIASSTERGAAGLTPMCVVCQVGKTLSFFDRQSGLKTKNHAS